MDFLQNFIHRLEVGGGMRYVRISVAVLAVVALFGGYNWRAFRNMSTQEAMDAAQLGRNLAEGKGYHTLFIRPFSMYLVKKHNQEKAVNVDLNKAQDWSELKTTMHPDLANPPVYPVVLAGLMKVLPFDYKIPDKAKPFWMNGERFWRYQPDFLIAVFNQVLFFAVVVLVFLLARRLFEPTVAWIGGALVLGADLLWRFSVSGLSTMLLLLIYTVLVWCLVLLEEEIREPKGSSLRLYWLAGAVGLFTALGALTRYSFGWLIVPVMLFVLLFTGKQRVVLGLTVFLFFVAALTPWVVRNMSVCGVPFGTATYAVMEKTSLFPEHKLERSLEPDFTQPMAAELWRKMVGNLRQSVQGELPKLGGSWISAFFLVGLLVGFRHPGARRVRYFVLFTLATLMMVQALGRTQLSEDSPDLNSENLLVLVVPLVLVYGVSFFVLLLDQLSLPFRELRYLVIGLFCAVGCLPLVLTFLPPRTIPVAYPPYYPPALQTIGGYMKPEELVMSDVPWAMAWYGHRQCVWLTLNAQSDFFAIHDFQKPVSALYLTPLTMDSRFLSQWLMAGEQGWGSFVLDALVRKEPAPSFPLRRSQPGWLPQQVFLTDRERWPKAMR